MRRDGETLRLSATDLANHLVCHHLTQLNRKVAHGQLEKPQRNDPFLEAIIERGNSHEKAYVDSLRTNEIRIVEFEFEEQDVVSKTASALNDGVDVVVQGALSNGQWSGRPDLLLKVDAPSRAFETWSYEVADTKLTRNTKAGTILQLCLYSDLLTELQQAAPEHMKVIMPGDPFRTESHRFDDFSAYYRFVKRQLEATIQSVDGGETYPDAVEHCGICRWWSQCNEKRRDDDHLSFVAGMSRPHIREVNRQGLQTLADFANADSPLPNDPERGSPETFERIHRQAKIQLKGRETGTPQYEYCDVEEERGFLLLPEPDSGDLFFDIESARHFPDGGLEYLFGYVTKEQQGKVEFTPMWAFDRAAEKTMFEQFVDRIISRRVKFPAMHVYHFAPYEPAALRRLSLRHNTMRDELRRLEDEKVFVDLFSIVRQGLRCSVESYSIKNLEQFYGYERLEELESAAHARHRFERRLESESVTCHAADDQEIVRVYNQDDCLSTLTLRDWLEDRRSELVEKGTVLPRPATETLEDDEINEHQLLINELKERLLNGIDPIEPKNRDEEQAARWLLANSLEYFSREYVAACWEYFRLHGLEPEELLDDRHAIDNLQLVKEFPPEGRRKVPIHRYKFEPQEFSTKFGERVVAAGDAEDDTTIGYVEDVDASIGLIDIRRTGATAQQHPKAIVLDKRIRPKPMPESLLEFAGQVAEALESGKEPTNARYDLLRRFPPRLRNNTSIPTSVDTDVAVELAKQLNESILAIQGPPGAGKTHTGSHIIVALARMGKRVGVTAVSHKVIASLLEKSLEVSKEDGGPPVLIAQKKGDKTRFVKDLEFLGDMQNLESALNEGKIVGGTAWIWSNPRIAGKLDYLFVDEAGQMSLAMVLAAARATKNLILLGDPQQLDQPQRADHPEGSEVAALTHLLDGKKTIAQGKGLFLGDTYRLHPSICQFTSEQYYENRLNSINGLEVQTLIGGSHFTDSGLYYVPVEHDGNQSRSTEEVEVVHKIIRELQGHSWTHAREGTKPLGPKDILVVAPYNSQVAALRRSLKKAAMVGTVDKFQGQEGAVVIYSLTSSSVDDAPRGMSFLFSQNRLNVATSRARCTTVVVGTPALFAAWCSNVDQLRLANGFCRYLEMATELPP